MTEERKVINLAERKKQKFLASTGQKVQSESDDGIDIPDFIDPPTIMKMTDEQIDHMLNLIRVNRMTSQLMYQKTVVEKEKAAESKAREQLEKKCEQVFKELERTFKVIDKLELRINEMRALRLQCGLDFNPEQEQSNA